MSRGAPTPEKLQRLQEGRDFLLSELGESPSRDGIKVIAERMVSDDVRRRMPSEHWWASPSHSAKVGSAAGSLGRLLRGESINSWILDALDLVRPAPAEPAAPAEDVPYLALVVLHDMRDLLAEVRDATAELAKGQRIMLSGQLPIDA